MIAYHFTTPIAITVAYLFGSISSAVIICQLMGLPDPRTEGSKNPGATNVLRLGGKQAAVITLLGDVLKGIIPVVAARWLGLEALGLALVALAAFIGHLYPVFFQFQGGKGVATLLGCSLALNGEMGLAMMLTWSLMAFIFRYSSLSSLVTAILAPLYAWYFANGTYAIVIAIMSALLVYRHRSNIRNLFTGKEKKIGKK